MDNRRSINFETVSHFSKKQITTNLIKHKGSYTKGMCYTFDLIKFAEEIIGASDDFQERYFITDIWGTPRDIRDALLILTESQLKLWNCYSSWEDYYYNCIKNKYTFRLAKVAPDFEEMDQIKQLNYQFVAPLRLSDEDVSELVKPTVDEIKDIMGMDVRKCIAYLCGKGLDEDTIEYADIMARCLMVAPEMINDTFIRNKVKRMIKRRITDAKICVLDSPYSNFQIISGDIYALAESIFGLEPKGLLKSGEIYSYFWIDKGVDKVLCARAPMSNSSSLLTQSISYSDEAQKWFKYMDSVVVINAWDTAPMALNGCDFDGDLLFTTTNKTLINNQKNRPALRCIQHKAEKKIITEDDLIKSNLDGFGSQIGQITNRCASITSIMANYEEDSKEYKILEYRTQCFQNGQQNEIDKAKGIVTNPLPKSWWVYSENKIKEDDSDQEIEKKKLYSKLCASKKPYFFAYVYPSLKLEYDTYIKNSNSNAVAMYKKSIDLLVDDYYNGLIIDENQQRFIQNYINNIPLDSSKSTINKICWEIEKEFDGVNLFEDVKFDYTILKTDKEYDKTIYEILKHICSEYTTNILLSNKRNAVANAEDDRNWSDIDSILDNIIENIVLQCPNEEDMCNILLDLCYKGNANKQIVWKACGELIYNRLLEKHNYVINYPAKDKNGDFWCQGVKYSMKTICKKETEEYED